MLESIGRIVFFYFVFAVIGGISFRIISQKYRSVVLSMLSLAALYLVFFAPDENGPSIFAVYVALVTLFIVLIVKYSDRPNWLYLLAFFPPVLALIVYKIFSWTLPSTLVIVGVSYTSFRISYLAYELNSAAAERRGFFDYFSHAFFLPTFFLGPISPFSLYSSALDRPVPYRELRNAIPALFLGLLKFFVFGPTVAQFSFMGIIDGAYIKTPLEYIVSIYANLAYLYLNFSGLSSIAVGVSAVVGINLMDNFNKPFLQNNIREFWNHWHISLSTYMRNVVYTPLLMTIMRTRIFRDSRYAASVASFVTFFLIGIWHGDGWNFVVLGLLYAIGVIYVIWSPDVLGLILRGDQGSLSGALKLQLSRVVTISYMALCVSFMFIPVDKVAEVQSVTAATLRDLWP